jgi:hypothetical protein
MKDMASTTMEFHGAALCFKKKGSRGGFFCLFVEPLAVQSNLKGEVHIPTENLVCHEHLALRIRLCGCNCFVVGKFNYNLEECTVAIIRAEQQAKQGM